MAKRSYRPAGSADEDVIIAAMTRASGLNPPDHLRAALLAEMRDLRSLAAVLKTLPLDEVESASVFRVPSK